MSKQAKIINELLNLMADALPAMPTEESIHIPFLEMGANSLVLMEVQRNVENRFGVNITLNQFFEELTNIDALAAFIANNSPVYTTTTTVTPQAANDPIAATLPTAPSIPQTMQSPQSPKTTANPMTHLGEVASTELEQILAQQLETASNTLNDIVNQQLNFLCNTTLAPTTENTATPSTAPTSQPAIKSTTQPTTTTSPQQLLSPLEIRARGLTPVQHRHLEDLISRFTERTQTSKQLTAQHRAKLADSRAAIGFRFTTKEMLYQLYGQRAAGSHIWDVDGNKYIDITMGQGVNLFGHNAPFLAAALVKAATETAMPGPPRTTAVGEAAELIAELTGLDRVAFTNSGTEAVMAALRLARGATKRDKIILFENAYHGHSDATLVKAQWHDGVLQTTPLSAGIPQGVVETSVVLEYGTDASLAYIRQQAHECAAVLVEPVQSRRPDLQPREFLQAVREITQQTGTLLIFDEMVTGFRIHPGGAQAWFGVQADLVTYGKLVGGGLPIGVVAGKAQYMDGIDGGMWQYGDNSYPTAERVVFGGTFCQHPIAMATTLATLKHLKATGPALQERLNQRTQYLAEALNTFLTQEELPLKVVYFGSLFRFAFSDNLELMFYHLMLKGVFVWEWRNCFLSTAHSDADIEHIIQAVKETLLEMREGGFIPAKSGNAEITAQTADVASTTSDAPSTVPLSTAQQQLWTLAQIAPHGSLAYHIRVTLRLQGTLDVAALQRAVQHLVKRHTALRTVIRNDAQVILPTLELPLETLKCDQTKLNALLSEVLHKPFELTQGAFFRVHLLELTAQEHFLVLNGHHIVVDGLSINIITQDLAAFYNSECQGQSLNLAPALQFHDYLTTQQQALSSATMAQHAAYWQEEFAGTLPVLDLPTDYPLPAIRSYQGHRETVQIPPALRDQIAQLSKAQNCTPFMLWFAAYALWLHRLSGQTELIVGIPTLGRNQQGSDKLVGYCTHLLAIRSELAGTGQRFSHYLATVRAKLLAAYQHQDYPYAQLLKKLDVHSDGSHLPLVSVIFNLDQPGAVPPMQGLQVDWVPQPVQYTAFDLTFNLTEVGETAILECDYNCDIFKPETIQRWLGHFLTLLQGIVADIETQVSALPLLTDRERQQILVDWNQTAADYPKDQPIAALFAQQVEKTPEAVAVTFAEQQLTYAQLNQRANQLAWHLQRLGIQPETLVGVCMERSLEMVIALWGVLKAGGAYLPLDPSYPSARLAFMLEDAQVAVLLTQEKLRSQLPEQAASQVLCLDGLAGFADRVDSATPSDFVTRLQQANASEPSNQAQPHNLAYLMYTSGSTGKPKGTMITQRSMVNYLYWAVQAYEVAQGAGAPVHSSISFDATITSLFAPLLAGCTLALQPEREQTAEVISRDLVAELSQQRHWSLVKLTPAHMELLNNLLPVEQLAQQSRYLIFGGEALTAQQIAMWREHAPETRLINEYGPTETVVGCCVYQISADTPTEGAVPIGRPIANTQLYILDPALQPVPIGVPGELYIGGDGVARGYLNRPDLTAERFIANPFITADVAKESPRLYRTGDLARYLPDGNLEYLGRVDNQVKIRGYRRIRRNRNLTGSARSSTRSSGDCASCRHSTGRHYCLLGA